MSTPLGCDEKSSRVDADMINVTDTTGKTWKISNQNLFANLPISENPFDIDALSPIATLEDNDYFAVLDNTDGQHKKISKANLESEIGGGGGGDGMPFVHIRDTKNSGTSGGTFTSGAWRTRDLTEKKVDTDNICTLAANQFTLPAGTYRMIARAPGNRVGWHQAWLYNVDTEEKIMIGSNAFTYASAAVQTDSWLIGRFTIAVETTFEIQHRCGTTRSSDGFGRTNDWTGNEIYTEVLLWQEV